MSVRTVNKNSENKRGTARKSSRHVLRLRLVDDIASYLGGGVVYSG